MAQPQEEQPSDNVPPLREDYICSDVERVLIEKFAEKLRTYRQAHDGNLPDTLAYAMWGTAKHGGTSTFDYSTGHFSRYALSKTEVHSMAAGLFLKP